MLVYTLFDIPLEIAFLESGCQWDALSGINFAVDVLFCVDIVVAFHTGFYERVRGEDVLQVHQQIVLSIEFSFVFQFEHVYLSHYLCIFAM